MMKRLKFRERLYLSEGISGKKLDKLKKKLEKNPLLSSVYLIVPAGNPENQLEIIDAKQLVQPYYKNIGMEVLGIAFDYEEALKLIELIVQECLTERGDCRLREYLSC